MAAPPTSIQGAHDVVAVDDVIVTIAAAPGRRARRRSRLAGPVSWPASRTTVRLSRTDTTGRWEATFAYEGQSAVLAWPQKRLDDLVAFADAHLGGMQNTVMDAERDRQARREAGR